MSSAVVGVAGSSDRSSRVDTSADEMTAAAAAGKLEKIRISKIGGRFLVFDVADVARLRREQSMCAILIGITPQAPNQTVFSSLPLELTADEVRWLVYDRQAARVVDDYQQHVTNLALRTSRRSYAARVQEQRRAAQAVADEVAAERERRGAAVRAAMAAKAAEKKKRAKSQATAQGGDLRKEEKEEKKEEVKEEKKEKKEEKKETKKEQPLVRITPTTSAGLVDRGIAIDTETGDGHALVSRYAPSSPSATALRAHLADRGYYTTPGLRFGGQLSVYPGDPFRYHAHFVASSYAWDEPMCLLDIVGTGRLATGVKKGLLIGAAKPLDGDADADGQAKRLADNVRTFTLEWAAI